MISFLNMLKQNIKLLLRNPAFIISILLLPIASTLMFKIQYKEADVDTADKVIELNSDNMTVVDDDFSKLIVLAYDNSHSAFSNWMLDELNTSGLFKIYAYKTDSYPKNFNTWAKDYMDNNTLKVILYFPKDFDEKLMDGKASGIKIYKGDNDDRNKLLESVVENSLKIMANNAELSKNKEECEEKLEDIAKDRVDFKKVSCIKEGKFDLTDSQNNQIQNIAFAVAIISIAFVLSGVLNANIIIFEKRNLVLTRVRLSNTPVMVYVLAKITLAGMITVIQTIISAVGLLIFTDGNLGIGISDFILFTASLGLIFNTLCVICGLLTENVINALYFSFGAWMITNTLSGVYFPGMELKGWIGKVSDFTPQSWILTTSKMIMTKESGAYSTYIAVVIAFLAFIGIVGFVLSKFKTKY